MSYLISGYGSKDQPNITLYNTPETPLWSSSIPNPSFLCQKDNLLFAVGEFDDHCTITSFLRDADGSFGKEIDTIQLKGTCLCHLSAHSEEHFLAGSCWGDGTFFTISYGDDGKFGDILYEEQQSNDTSDPSRVHCALILGNYIYVVNIELDLIFCYQQTQGIPTEYSRLNLPKGTGPRHIYANEEKKLFYCVTEYSSQLLTIDYRDPANMKLIQTQSLLEPDFEGESYGSTLAVTQDHRHLYAANRGENTIAHFLLDENGMPIYSDRTPCLGDWPRHIALTDGDSLLAVANQKSGEVVFLERDKQNGRIKKGVVRKVEQPQVSFITEI